MQVSQELNRIGKYRRVYALPIYGGKSIEAQIRSIQQGVDIIVGTPGRVIDHIERGTLLFDKIAFVVIDEADKILNMGFIDDVERILRNTPQGRQTMLFSATMPQPIPIVDIARRHMQTPEKVKANTKDVVVPKISQVFYEVRESEKINALKRLLDMLGTLSLQSYSVIQRRRLMRSQCSCRRQALMRPPSMETSHRPTGMR